MANDYIKKTDIFYAPCEEINPSCEGCPHTDEEVCIYYRKLKTWVDTAVPTTPTVWIITYEICVESEKTGDLIWRFETNVSHDTEESNRLLFAQIQEDQGIRNSKLYAAHALPTEE